MKVSLAVLMVACCVPAAAMAQEFEFPSPQKQHQWLEKFAGEWESVSECSMGPDQPPMICKGTMSSKMLGGFWVITEMNADMMGTPIKAVQTIGYDPAAKKFVGSWVDSATSHLWKYEGSLDKTGTKLTLEADGPSFVSPGKMAKFRDAYEFKSPDHIVTTSSMQGEDGQWITFAKGDSRRKQAAAK